MMMMMMMMMMMITESFRVMAETKSSVLMPTLEIVQSTQRQRRDYFQ